MRNDAKKERTPVTPERVRQLQKEGLLVPALKELDLTEAIRRVTERERLLCPMDWPPD